MSVFFQLQATPFSLFFFFLKASISVKNYRQFGVRLIEECFPVPNSKDLGFSLKLGRYQKRNIVGH